MNKEEAIKGMTRLMEESKVCYLSTLTESHQPQIRALENLRNPSLYPKLIPFFKENNEPFNAYLSTNTSSSKVDQIKANPQVALYYSDPDDHRGLMLEGEMEIVRDMEIKTALWHDYWTMYYPGEGGVYNDDYTVLKLQPKQLKFYHSLQFFTLKLED